MGKGIALQFQKAFPNNYKVYRMACNDKSFGIGELLVTEEESLLHGKKIIIDFPTKTDWRKPSEYSYIEIGLQKLKNVISERNIKSIAIPPLGTGNGGLNWTRVKQLMVDNLSGLDCKVMIYEPNALIEHAMKKERVRLTPARAMLLAVLFEFIKNGEFVSEFAAEKVAYFLQRFGASEIFKLTYSANFYGPYSGKVKRVLFYLNGSYITGYSGMDRKPFEELGIVMDAENDVLEYLKNSDSTYLAIVNKTKDFLSGFYSAFGLELLSTIDFLSQNNGIITSEGIMSQLNQWSDRKRTLFSDENFVKLALKRLSIFELIKL